jgi:hypothetical protein
MMIAMMRHITTCCLLNMLQVEMLYQRYFLRMNQSHLVHLLVLLVALCSLLLLIVLLDVGPRLLPSVALITCLLTYLGLLVMLAKPSLNELYLLATSYVIIVTFLILTLLLALTRENGVSSTLALVFLSFAMLPVHLYEAVLSGLILAAAYLIAAAYMYAD